MTSADLWPVCMRRELGFRLGVSRRKDVQRPRWCAATRHVRRRVISPLGRRSDHADPPERLGGTDASCLRFGALRCPYSPTRLLLRTPLPLDLAAFLGVERRDVARCGIRNCPFPCPRSDAGKLDVRHERA